MGKLPGTAAARSSRTEVIHTGSPVRDASAWAFSIEAYTSSELDEKWMYELAYLYHRVGLETKCVEECDELILWFREGKYIKKAVELKMLHQQLTGEQDVLY